MAFMTREDIIESAIIALERRGYFATTFLESNTCFDIIARKGELALLVKVYENIDSIRSEQAQELSKLSNVLGASPIIIGGKTKAFRMENNTVYSRYDVPAVTITTFENVLEHENPTVRYFKGRQTVDINSTALRKKRIELNLSLRELAQKIGVAQETLHRFEKGSSTSIETANALQHQLSEDFSKPIDVLLRSKHVKVDEIPDQSLLGKMRDLGLKMALFEHAPFDAFGEEGKNGIFISTGKGKFDIPKKAFELKKTTAVIESDSIIVTKEYKYRRVDGIPVIEESDLDTIGKIRELKKLIEEKDMEK